MNILLLGGSGYIGSKFYSTYQSKYKIRSIDLQLFQKDNFSEIINYNTISINQYDVIVCFAGHSSVQMCEYSPERSWINNVEYHHNLFKKLTHNQKLIYMSSASVYGNNDTICSEDQDMNINPIQNYDLQKIIIDIIANKYIAEGKSIVGLRLGTVNGPSPNTRKELMLNSMVKNSIENNYIKIKNLSMRRSILGINDLMRAIECIINGECKSGQYNLASFTMTVEELANIVSKIYGSQIIEEPSDKIYYSFEISTKKFKDMINFEFLDKPTNIVKELIANHDITNYTIRDNDANFKLYI